MTRRYGGTGLGLSISKHLIEMMGGRIGVESRLGHGSTFWFTVLLNQRPIKAAERVRRIRRLLTSEPRPAAPATGVTTGRQVLVVEDNEVNQVVILGVLENLGYAAEVAANGCEALERLSCQPAPSLVLMDLQMPEMDGFETTRRIRDPRSSVLRHDIPIIAMTAHALKEDRQRCLDAGIDDYIAKPFMPEEVAAALERHLKEAECS